MNTSRRLLGSRISLGQEETGPKSKKDLARSHFATLRNNSSGGSLGRLGKEGMAAQTNRRRQNGRGNVKNNVPAQRKEKKKAALPIVTNESYDRVLVKWSDQHPAS